LLIFLVFCVVLRVFFKLFFNFSFFVLLPVSLGCSFLTAPSVFSNVYQEVRFNIGFYVKNVLKLLYLKPLSHLAANVAGMHLCWSFTKCVVYEKSKVAATFVLLPVSLGCSFLTAPSVFSNVY
jgi:hypothetical protein